MPPNSARQRPCTESPGNESLPRRYNPVEELVATRRPPPMAIRFRFLVMVSVLSGCAYPGPYFGVRNECGPVPESVSAQCQNRRPMTHAEYETARNKLRHSRESGTTDETEGEEQLHEIVPLDPRYKSGTP